MLSIKLLVPRISASQTKQDEAMRIEQEELDIKCLQLLRSTIHNEIVKLPEDWESNPVKHQRYTCNSKAEGLRLELYSYRAITALPMQ